MLKKQVFRGLKNHKRCVGCLQNEDFELVFFLTLFMSTKIMEWHKLKVEWL